MARLLAVVRYSGEDDTGAMDRQQRMISEYVRDHPEHTLVKIVQDESTSGGAELEKRRDLGPWMVPPKFHEWDQMIIPWQSRLVRDDLEWGFIVWRFVKVWGKKLVNLSNPHMDLSTPNGRIQAGLTATQDANYRLDTIEAVLRAREDHRRQNRFTGGNWPYGYRAIPREKSEGEGWKVVVDPISGPWVRYMVDEILAGRSLKSVARDLNEQRVLTPRNHQKTHRLLSPDQEREPIDPNTRWTGEIVHRSVRNPAVMGYRPHKGDIYRENGLPVKWSEGIIDPKEYLEVSEVLKSRNNGSSERKNRSDLSGVILCPEGHNMHHWISKKKYREYRCSKALHVAEDVRCGYKQAWPEDRLKLDLEYLYLSSIGDLYIQTSEYVPGKDRKGEIITLEDAITNLSGNLANLTPGSTAANSIINTINEYEQQLREIKAEPVVPSGYRYKSTGVTYRQKWMDTPSWRERGLWLLNAGIRLVVDGTRHNPNINLVVPDDLDKRMQDAMNGVEYRDEELIHSVINP